MVYAIFDNSGKCIAYEYSIDALLGQGYKKDDIEEIEESEFWKGYE
jgi:hypothetical protein